MKALELEIAILKTKLQLPFATGHIYTAISVLEARINEILGKESVHD